VVKSSETSAFNTQTPGKYPEDNLSLIQHGESLKTRTDISYIYVCVACCPHGCQACDFELEAFVLGIPVWERFSKNPGHSTQSKYQQDTAL
jgi:hypothetical protein